MSVHWWQIFAVFAVVSAIQSIGNDDALPRFVVGVALVLMVLAAADEGRRSR